MKKFFAVFFAAVPLFFWAAEYHVSGTVTSPELRNVLVCDGEKFHPVGADGKYDFRFATEGAGFVYLEFPDTQKAKTSWSSALQPGENRVDFTLVASGPQPERFTFLHGSVVQYDFKQKSEELANDMRELAETMKAYQARFITFPGDLTELGDREQLTLLRREIEKNGMNYYAFFGGHDRYRSKPSLKNFADCFGAPYFSWNFGGIHFIAPVSEYQSLEKFEQTRQPAWIENDLRKLAPGTPVLLITHQPWYVLEQIGKLAKDVKFRFLGSLGAHTHYHNLYECNAAPVLCVAPLRAHDTGTFTKRLRLVTVSAKEGIVSTKTRLMNQVCRAEATLYGGRELLVRIADTVRDARSVDYAIDAFSGKMTRMNEFVWRTVLPEKLADRKYSLYLTVVNEDGTQWKKRLTVADTKQIKWTAVLPMFQRQYPTPAADDGKIFLGLESGELPSGRGGVAAFDAATGKQLWFTHCADVPRAVAAKNGIVRALTVNGELLALNAADGKILRRDQLPLSHAFCRPEGHVEIVGDRVLALWVNLACGGAALYCFNSDGTSAWAKPLDLGSAWSSIDYSVRDGVIYFNGYDCYGAAKLSDGTDLWRKKERLKVSAGRPLPIDGNVYYIMRATLRKVDAATGETRWEMKGFPGSSNTIGGLCVRDGRIVTTSTNALLTVEEATGKRLYRYNLSPLSPMRGGRFQFLANTAAPVFFKDSIVILGDDGGVYSFDPQVMKPELLFSTGFSFKGHPVVFGDMLYFVGFDGVLYAMDRVK